MERYSRPHNSLDRQDRKVLLALRARKENQVHRDQKVTPDHKDPKDHRVLLDRRV